jgi:mono/diheme cytochrome c family protein
MTLSQHLPKIVIALVLVGGVAVIATKGSDPSGAGAMVDVKVPELSQTAMAGKRLYDGNCVACHGDNGAGGKSGPPLIHNTYNPGHHDDRSFQRAARNGVPRHHWNFGDMPPQPQINPGQMAEIILYVREVQMANGIFYQEHKM